jgi:hypothetical protein
LHGLGEKIHQTRNNNFLKKKSRKNQKPIQNKLVQFGQNQETKYLEKVCKIAKI